MMGRGKVIIESLNKTRDTFIAQEAVKREIPSSHSRNSQAKQTNK